MPLPFESEQVQLFERLLAETSDAELLAFAGEHKEEDHPRDDDGKWAPKEGGGGSDEDDDKPKTEPAAVATKLAESTMADVKERYPSITKNIRADKIRIGTDEEMKGEGLGYVRGGVMFLSKDLGDPEAVREFHEANKGLFVATSGSPEDTARAVVMHEMGHFVDMKGLTGNRNEKDAALEPIIEAAMGGDAPVSIYAQENRMEAFAELFAASMMGYKGDGEKGEGIVGQFTEWLDSREAAK